MQTDYTVLAPGPVNLHPRVREALALPMIHHRTPEFDKILRRALAQLQRVFQTTQPAYILTATGSGGMESLLVNVLSPGDEVLGIDSGKFGERWCDMVTAFGAKLERLKVPWGQAVSVAAVEAHLKAHPQTRAVICQACETSTGVVHPVQELGALIHNYPSTLFLVDAITALGAMELPMDAWHLDGVVGGSQKAFMLPTGLSFVSFSAKAWARVATAETPRFYFDIRLEDKANRNGETFFSSNVSLIRALDVSLELVFAKGWSQHLRDIQTRARFVREFGQKLGLRLYAQAPSDSVTALLVPTGVDSQKLRLNLETQHHITIMGGQDQAKGKIIRVGHMGDISWSQMQQFFLALRTELLALHPDLPMPTREALTQAMQDWIHHAAL